MIEFKDVHKTYPDGTEAIKNFNLKVQEGELLTLIGPSGCGKTTTMKMINRLVEPSAGDIYIDGKDLKDYNIHELRWNIGYVLQQIALFPHMTVEENIAVVPEMKKWKKQQIRDRAKELMQMVGMEPSIYMKKKPSELSGGQAQRVGVIRALAADPQILLMDEPFSALDPISREGLQKDIRKLQQQIKKTIVFVTHDIDEATALGDRICLMNAGEIIQVDTPQELILKPLNSFVRSFIGDKKSPWQTAVDIVVAQTVSHILTQTAFEAGNFDPEQAYILTSDDGQILCAVEHGKQKDILTIPNDMNVLEAVRVFEKARASILPVAKGDELIGTVTQQELLHYLASKTEVKNGVVTQ
ncbi:ABC transporter ATP-binding protein [Terribacillus sp. 179-K 1B1 HS]|uniref:ABC transporter ATP-binding protein n=1 Tax=Terribacillus sp. 179-K 1B1 HS TaxID=3142388 RepID=UPI0039A1B64D